MVGSIRALRLRRVSGIRAAGIPVAVLGLALTACGVPIQSRPVALSASQIPSGLTAAPTTTTLPGSTTPVSIVQIYFVAGDRLVARSRLVPSPGTLTERLAALLAGPTLSESAAGMRTAINPDTVLLDDKTVKDRATIDLSDSFTDTGGPDQILAIAQFVYTATSTGPEGTDSVSFEVGGNPVAVPVADGTLVSGPVTQADYEILLSNAGGHAPAKPS